MNHQEVAVLFKLELDAKRMISLTSKFHFENKGIGIQSYITKMPDQWRRSSKKQKKMFGKNIEKHL